VVRHHQLVRPGAPIAAFCCLSHCRS
jgi:hypothetical protein